MNTVYCFTDGSCLNNNQSDITKRRGGIGVVFLIKPPVVQAGGYMNNSYQQCNELNISHGYLPGMLQAPITNQTMELLAIYEALVKISETFVLKQHTIYLYTDSKFCHDVLTTWAAGWSANGWKKKDKSSIKNLSEIKKTYTLYQNIQACTCITIHHIRAHKKPPPQDSQDYLFWHGNNQADQIARRAAEHISK